MKFVKITHPKAGEAMVPESAVPHHARAGWRLAEEVEVNRAEPVEQEPQQQPSPRRRRENREEEQE